MKVRYIGDYYKVTLFKGKIYEVLSIENGWYKLLTELGDGDTAFFPPGEFEIVEK